MGSWYTKTFAASKIFFKGTNPRIYLVVWLHHFCDDWVDVGHVVWCPAGGWCWGPWCAARDWCWGPMLNLMLDGVVTIALIMISAISTHRLWRQNGLSWPFPRKTWPNDWDFKHHLGEDVRKQWMWMVVCMTWNEIFRGDLVAEKLSWILNDGYLVWNYAYSLPHDTSPLWSEFVRICCSNRIYPQTRSTSVHKTWKYCNGVYQNRSPAIVVLRRTVVYSLL